MLLWLLACGDEPKGEPEPDVPDFVDVSAQIQPYLESSGAPALGTARIQTDVVSEMGVGGANVSNELSVCHGSGYSDSGCAARSRYCRHE